MKRLFSVVLIPLLAMPAFSPAKPATPEYSIQAIRYASAEDEVAGLIMGSPKGEKIAIAMVIWLVCTAVELGLGFLLAYTLVSQYVLSGNTQAAAKGEQLRAKLAVYQAPLGLASIGLAVLFIIMCA